MKKKEITECIKQYVKGGASIGYCAQMAGMPEEEFIEELENA